VGAVMSNVNIKYNPVAPVDRKTPLQIAQELWTQYGFNVRFLTEDGKITAKFDKGSLLTLYEYEKVRMSLPAGEMTTLDKFEDIINYQGLDLDELRSIIELLS
jgi:hypothetical protein